MTQHNSAQHTHGRSPAPPAPTHPFPPAPPINIQAPTQTQHYGPIIAPAQQHRNHPYTQQHQVRPHQHRTNITAPTAATAPRPPQQATPTQPHTPTQSIHTSQQMTPTSEHNTPTSTHVQKHTVPHNVQIPDKWTQTADQYDSNTNLGGPVFKHIQPSAWSRRKGIQGQDPLTLPASSLIRYGCEDHAFRLLSQGKFIGLVPTRTVAESVFLSQLVKALRDQNIDLDSAAEGTHKGPMPNKQTEPIKYMTPLVQCIIKEIKSKEPVQTHLAQVQKLASTEAQLAKAQHKLQQHGIQITPQRKTSTTPALPTESQDNTQGSQRSPEDPTPPTQPEQPDQPEQPHQEEPPAKRPRKAKAKAGKEQEKNPTDLPMILHPTTSNNSHLGRQPSKQPHRHKGDTVD